MIGSFPFWLLVAGSVALVAWAYSAWVLDRPLSPGMRLGLALLRIVFVLALIALMAGPRVRRELRRLRPAYFAILIDDSESMNLPAGPMTAREESRLEAAQRLLDRNLLERLGKNRLTVSFWRASDLAPVQAPGEMAASAPTTQLGRALAGLRDKFDPGDLKAILLVSDGQNTAGESPLDVAARLEMPVFTLGLGSPEAAREVAIDELIVPEYAFPGESVPIHVALSQRGAEGDQSVEVHLRLSLEGKQLREEILVLPADETRREWTTAEVFTETGQYRLEVDIEPRLPVADRPLAAVRQARWKKSADVAILKNRYHVALLSGRPHWETKFARRALEEDPRLDILALWPKPDGQWALAAPHVPSGKSEEEAASNLRKALEAAPRAESLFENLSSLDLLVLCDLNLKGPEERRLALTAERMERLTDWVDHQGGALLVLGGAEMFGAGGEAFAALEPLLPVSLSNEYDYRTEAAFPRLTEAGQRSSALASWRQIDPSRLGPLETSHRLGPPKLGAETLLEDEEGHPLLAWHSYGLGRVMVLATDSFWRYGLPLAESELPAELFGNFWRELVRFLILGQKSSGVRLYTDGQQYLRGEQVRIWANIDSNLQVESAAAQVPVELRRAGSGEVERLFLSQSPQSPTLYEGSFRPQQEETYTLRLEVNRFQDEKRIQVTAPEEEYRRLNQNVGLLQEIAERSGGRYLPPGELPRLPSQIDFEARRETVSRSVFLGSLPWVLPLLLAFITTEWILRKRASLP